jgi:RND family efflux transporter MFP subunit
MGVSTKTVIGHFTSSKNDNAGKDVKRRRHKPAIYQTIAYQTMVFPIAKPEQSVRQAHAPAPPEDAPVPAPARPAAPAPEPAPAPAPALFAPAPAPVPPPVPAPTRPARATRPPTREPAFRLPELEDLKMPRSRSRLRVAVMIALPAAILALLATRLLARASQPGEPIAMAQPLTTLSPAQVREVGRIEPMTKAQIRSRVAGLVTDVHVREGDVVQEGQVLVSLDSVPFAREIDRLEAEVDEQKVMLAVARRTLSRLRSDPAADPADLDRAQGEAKLAAARLAKAHVALAAVTDQRLYSLIRAPFKGVVLQRNINPGETVMAGISAGADTRPLLVIADLAALAVKIDVSQLDVGKVRLGQRATVAVDTLGEPLTARVSQIASASTPGASGSKVFPVELTLEPNTRLTRLKPGMIGEVTVRLQETRAAEIVAQKP